VCASWGALSSKRLRILYTQEFHAGRREISVSLNPLHRLRGLLVRLDAAFPKLITLIETLDLQFELGRRPGRAAWAVRACAPLVERDRRPENFAMNEVNRTLAVGWHHRIGESSDTHIKPFLGRPARLVGMKPAGSGKHTP